METDMTDSTRQELENDLKAQIRTSERECETQTRLISKSRLKVAMWSELGDALETSRAQQELYQAQSALQEAADTIAKYRQALQILATLPD
jgi:hypothetical protein